MERRQLTYSLLIFLFVVSCQQTESLIIQNNINNEVSDIKEALPVLITEEIIEEPISVWEYIQNNSQLEDYAIDRTTQKYINNHIKDKDLFYSFLENSQK